MTKVVTRVQQRLERILRLYDSLPRYEVAERGRFSISKRLLPGNFKHTIVGARDAYFNGQPVLTALVNRAITEWQLQDELHGLWMNTSLQELDQMREPLSKLRGQVLIGGLGLGAIAHLAVQVPAVVSVTVVEREADLITLVSPFVDERIQIVHADLFDFIKTIPGHKYRSAFLDIWQSTGEWVWQTQIVPLRRAIAGKIRKVLCWQEYTMQAQVLARLGRAADMAEAILQDMGASCAHVWVFRKAVCDMLPEKRQPLINDSLDMASMLAIEEANNNHPRLAALMNIFVNRVGTHLWEKLFGAYWDQTLPLYKKGDLAHG